MKPLTKDDFRIVKEFYLNDFVYFIEQKYRGWLTGRTKWYRLESMGWSDFYTLSYEDAQKVIKNKIEDYKKIAQGAIILQS